MSSLISTFISKTDSSQSNSALDSDSHSPSSSQDQKLIDLLSPYVQPLGYQIIHLEVQTHRQKVLRLYIDHLNPPQNGPKIGSKIGIQDCVQVSRVLDEKLDQLTEMNSFFPGPTGSYELEVSSPGADRPLRSLSDFIQYLGFLVRIHVYRPLTADELNNSTYQKKNPRQKHFKGTLVGLRDEKVILLVSYSHEKDQEKGPRTLKLKNKAQKKARPLTNSEEGKVEIPLPLISKANLEPQFDFEANNERESKL